MRRSWPRGRQGVPRMRQDLGTRPLFFPSGQVSGGFSFPPSRPASCLARPQGVAMGTKRPQLACGGAACLVAFADLVAATVGAHGCFG